LKSGSVVRDVHVCTLAAVVKKIDPTKNVAATTAAST